MHTKPQLAGSGLIIAAVMLAASNFIVVLDMTIANVSVPHIAGGLAISSNEGTYVITSYAVAEAISVPLTGWLANRFGTVKVFAAGLLFFGLCSAICGFANSLGMLVVGRILQGLAGGPLMPLSQTILMSTFPKEKRMAAMAIWSMTTLIAPILGPIIGGYICDNWGWSWIFLINVPLAVVCCYMIWTLLKPFETATVKSKIDVVGLVLLIVSVGSLQLMLDEGQKLDWFSSPEIIILAITAIIGFAAFLIWELTEKNPIVDLYIFRHRSFSISVMATSLTFGAFFSSIVLTPLWLQTNMGYTATTSGMAMAAHGMFAVLVAPIAAKLASKVDPRKLVFCGVMWMGCMTFVRSFGSIDMTFAQVAVPLLFQGIGMPFFFIPLSALALSAVEPNEIASAAGLMNFLRTLSGAFAASIVTSAWSDHAAINRNELVSMMHPSSEIPVITLNQMVDTQSVMLATNQLFVVASLVLVCAATVVLFAPKPAKLAGLEMGH